HNIIQRFRESGTISVRKGQGRKTIPDARDLRALRRHCITYRNAAVMEITTWAQEYFQKTLSVNTIHRAIRRRRLKLYRSKKKPYLNMIQKRRHFLWAKAHLKWTVAKWKTVLWSDESKCEVLFGKLGRHIIRTKEDKDNPSCYQRSVQKPASLMVWGCMSACGMGSLHIWKGTINAERYIQVLEQHLLPSRRPEQLRVKGLAQGPSRGSLVDLGFKLTTFQSNTFTTKLPHPPSLNPRRPAVAGVGVEAYDEEREQGAWHVYGPHTALSPGYHGFCSDLSISGGHFILDDQLKLNPSKTELLVIPATPSPLVVSGGEGALMDIEFIHSEHAHPSSPILWKVLSFLSQEAELVYLKKRRV
ncbi:hypothetical protein QTP70_035034, partial [Hemibagrus guttatus]